MRHSGLSISTLLGTLALALALGASGAAAVAAVAGRSAWGRRLLGVGVALVGVAVVLLARALVGRDWSLVYVADFTSRDSPWPYRLAALWAGMAGSLLVWTLFVGVAGAAVVRWARWRLPEIEAPVTAGVGLLGAALVGLLLWATPPFRRLEIPAIDGAGLTPVLRHPAMLYHPLLLYAGQVALLAPFAIAVAARWRRLPAERWQGAARVAMVVAVALLGVAMVAGAHWAYVELGWGGYWAWDPVENTALLPWLAGLAFLHGSRRGAGQAWASVAFVLGLGGAFLTRSGATASVHAFGDAAVVGRVFVALLAAAVGVAVWAGVRGRALAPAPSSHPLSRERALTVAATVLGGLVVVVAAGTALPLLRRDGVIVTGRYFSSVAWPFALALLALSGAGPRLRWGRTTPADAVRRLAPGLVALPAGAAVAMVAFDAPSAFAVAAAALGAASVTLTVAELVERRSAGLVAHLGAAILLVGVAGTATGAHVSGVLGPDQTVTVRGYVLRLDRITEADAEGPGAAVRATIDVRRRGGDGQDGRHVATLRPLAMLAGDGQRVSVAGLRSTPFEDLQVTLRAVGPKGESAVVDVTVLPLMQWVWWGGLLIVGAVVGVGTRHGRNHAADRRPQPSPGLVHQVPSRLQP